MDYIVIPTLGRIDKQKTYDSLPERLQNITRFVVRDFEYEDFVNKYGTEKVVKLPSDTKNIAETRHYIFNSFRDYKYWVLDDDLSFVRKIPYEIEIKPKWTSMPYDDSHFDDMINWAESIFDSGIPVCGLEYSSIIPDIKYYPVKKNSRILANLCVNGPQLQNYDLTFLRTIASEDLDFILQLFSYGIENRINTHLRLTGSVENSDGGCSTYRTLELHNESNLRLIELWPGYVSRNMNKNKSKLGHGDIVNLKIQWKKLLKDAQKGLYNVN